MKLFLATVVVIGSCMLFIAGSTGLVVSSTSKPLPLDMENKNADMAMANMHASMAMENMAMDNMHNGRFFFNFNSDPCTNSLYTMLNIADAKCSVQCYFQAGLQQGGYCDENSVCQCNQIST